MGHERVRAIVVAAFSLVVLSQQAAPAAAPPPADTNCPRAVKNLIAYNDAAASNDAAKIEAAAKAAADSYRLCANETRVVQPIEPRVNYDLTRAAQFLVVEGRAQAAAGRASEATSTLRDAYSVADEVATWTPSAMSYSTSNAPSGTSSDRNSDKRGSRYRDAAVEIRAAADAELKKLGAAPAASTAPSPAASPAH